MWFWNIIKSLFETPPPAPFLGVAPDTRSEEEILNDPIHEEVAGGAVPLVTWIEKPPETWVKILPIRNQDGSSECVMVSNAAGLQADRGLKDPLSGKDGYDQRSNYPAPGTIPMEGLQITARGLCKESTVPSDNMSEQEINIIVPTTDQIIAERKETAGGTPVKLTSYDVDIIASILAQGMKVRIAIEFAYNEWTAIPQLIHDGGLRHQIIAVDWSLVNGKKCIIIQDSWGQTTTMFSSGHRALTQDFLNQRCFFAGYIKYATPVVPNPSPAHVFTQDLEYGMRGNEVKLMQMKLQSLGFFKYPDCTGYFGGITRQAVIAFQSANGIQATGIFGPLSRAKINSL